VRDDKRYLDFYIVDEVGKSYHGVFQQKDVLVIASAPLSDSFPSYIMENFVETKRPFEMRTKLYTFPSENLESCFFHLNLPVQRLVSEYLKLHRDELNGRLLPNLKLFREPGDAIGQMSKPPRALVDVGDLEAYVT